MPLYDDLTVGLRYPMFSVTSPPRMQSRVDSDKPTDQLMNVPPDGDTKSADPESWIGDRDVNPELRINRDRVMRLPGLGMEILAVNDVEMRDPVMNFIDDDIVPPGEIWVRMDAYRAGTLAMPLLSAIIYSFLVWKENHPRDKAKKIAESIVHAMSSIRR